MNKPRAQLMAIRCSFIAMIAWFAVTLPAQPPGSKPGEKLPAVVACQVRSGEFNTSYRLLGTVTPSRTTTIGYAVGGRLKTLHAKRGNRLSSGEMIAELQTDVVKIEIAAAKAQLRLVQQQLAELVAGSREEDIAEAKARMEAAAAISRRNASQLKRLEKLVASKAASVDEVDAATAEADSSEQLLKAARIAYDRLVVGPRVEQVAQAQARVELQQEQVRLLEDRLTKHRVIAPFDGYVTSEYTEAGAWISSGDAVVDIIDLDTVEVEVAVPADQVTTLRPGQSIRVECEQYPAELLIGHLDRIVPAADTRARTFPVLVSIKNKIIDRVPMLMSGMVVRIDLPIGPPQNLTFVPTDSIVLNGTEQFVYVVNDPPAKDVAQPSSKVRRVPVKLGIADGKWIAVRGNLDAGSWVITKGNERLVSGQAVRLTIGEG